jgi:UbiD family decarboxylase
VAHRDLRGFIDVLEKEGQLVRMTEEVLPEPDISAILSANNKDIGDQAPAMRCISRLRRKRISRYRSPSRSAMSRSFR